MNLELDKQDIVNLLAALNAATVSGKEQMLVILRLMQKLEEALKEPKADE